LKLYFPQLFLVLLDPRLPQWEYATKASYFWKAFSRALRNQLIDQLVDLFTLFALFVLYGLYDFFALYASF